MKRTAATNTGFALGWLTWKLGVCASIQGLCLLIVLCSEIRPNAKPETVGGNYGNLTP